MGWIGRAWANEGVRDHRTGRAAALLRLVTVISAVSILVPAFVGTSRAQVTGCSADELKPQLREVMINQGLPSSTLVQGKEALFKLFLSKPLCASDSQNISITGATLNVTRDGSLLSPPLAPTQTLAPPAPVAPYLAAPAAKSTGDPLFSIPASYLTRSGGSRFQMSFAATVAYTTGSKTDQVVFDTLPATTMPITATVEKKTAPARVLAIPMGIPGRSNYTDLTSSTVLSAFDTLSRILPVAQGAADITSGTAAGIQHKINSAALLDVSRFVSPSSGKFCGGVTNFDEIQPHLANFLQQYNAANASTPSKMADSVMGVIDQTISSCAHGMGAVGGDETWVRAIHSAPETPMTGSLMAMELAHNLKVVPDVRDSPLSPTHSPRAFADFGYNDRGYNLATKEFLANDLTVMTLTSGWTNHNTLLEKLDWDQIWCNYGGPTSADCAAPSTATGGPSAAEEVSVFIGTTGGDPENTEVRDTFVAPGRGDPPDETSTLRAIERLGPDGEIVSNHGVRTSDVSSVHEHQGSANHAEGGDLRAFSVAYPHTAGATCIELVENGTTLFSRCASDPPTITAMNVGLGGPDCGLDCPLEVVQDTVEQVSDVDGLLRRRSLNGYTVTLTAEDDNPRQVRFNLFTECDGTNLPSYVGEKGEVVGNTVTKTLFVDTSNVCTGNGLLTLKGAVNDGFSVSPYESRTVPVLPEQPQAEISTPYEGARVLEHAALHGSGSGSPGSTLTWFLSGPGLPEQQVGAGTSFTLPAPAGGRTPGKYVLRLEVTAANGTTADDLVEFEYVVDDDNDGVTAEHEKCSGGSDQDPFDAYRDYDGDGRLGFEDDDPCTPAPVDDTVVTMRPKPLNLNSNDVAFVAEVTERYRDLGLVDAGSVRITKIGGTDVSERPEFKAASWSVRNGVGIARFQQRAMVEFLDKPEYRNSYVVIEVRGGPASSLWRFQGSDSVFVQDKRES